MQKTKDLWILLFAGSWFLFALIIFFALPPWSGLINILTCVIGLIGAGFACLCLFLRRPWVLFACLGSAVVLLSVYVIRWALFIQEYLSVDPEYGLLRTMWLPISSRLSIFLRLATDGRYLRALTELYWTLGMPVLQLVIISALFWPIGREKKL